MSAAFQQLFSAADNKDLVDKGLDYGYRAYQFAKGAAKSGWDNPWKSLAQAELIAKAYQGAKHVFGWEHKAASDYRYKNSYNPRAYLWKRTLFRKARRARFFNRRRRSRYSRYGKYRYY